MGPSFFVSGSQMTEQAKRIAAWTHYWSSGATHSCSTSFGLSVDEGGLGKFWRDVFSSLSTSACIVDLATGNGGLLQMADNFAQAKANKWELVGVDLARPAPSWFDKEHHGKTIRFLGETAMEATGLASDCADAVISQFGIEYGARDKVQAECARLLRPDGRFAFVIHHHDSVITQVARDESIAQALLLSNGGLIEATNNLSPHLARVRAGEMPGELANQARQAFNKAMDDTLELSANLSAPDLLQQVVELTQQLFAKLDMGSLDEVQSEIAELHAGIEWARLRTREQMECALSEACLRIFLQPFSDMGYQVDITRIQESGHLIAWGVTGKMGKQDQSSPSSEVSP